MTITAEDVMEQKDTAVLTETVTLQFHNAPYGFYGIAYFKDTQGNCYEMDIAGPERRKAFADANARRGESIVSFTTKMKGPHHVHRIVQSIEPVNR